MENKTSAFKEYFSPILVLVVICFVTTFLLAFTYGITAPIIEKNTKENADKIRKELIEAESFTESDAELFVLEEGKVYVENVYVADNGAGMVVTVKTNSYGGALTAMIGIDADGAITGVNVTDHADTPGVGTKAHAQEHLQQYTGLTELTDKDVKKDSSVDHVTGASVSSGAVHKAIYCALEQYKAMGGVN